MTDIRDAIRDFIKTELKPPVPVEFDSPLIQQGIVDSLAVLILIGFIGERFGVEINPEDVQLENFESINRIRDLVVANQPSPPRPGGDAGGT